MLTEDVGFHTGFPPWFPGRQCRQAMRAGNAQSMRTGGTEVSRENGRAHVGIGSVPRRLKFRPSGGCGFELPGEQNFQSALDVKGCSLDDGGPMFARGRVICSRLECPIARWYEGVELGQCDAEGP